MDRSLAIIPARGGSTRLKFKNKRKIGNYTLVENALISAIKSKKFSEILVSTDDKDIASLINKYEMKYKSITVHHRNKRLSSNKATALELVNYLIKDKYKDLDFVSLLLPTCPFRNHTHIIEAFECFKKETDSVVSLTNYEFPITLSVSIEKNNIILNNKSPLITGKTRSQDQKTFYRPNGAIYISKIKSFMKYKNFWRGKVRPYYMSKLHSVDIDNIIDLNYANFLKSKKYV